jgi:hypothetical protein
MCEQCNTGNQTETMWQPGGNQTATTDPNKNVRVNHGQKCPRQPIAQKSAIVPITQN